ncbi:EcsC family protein [Streptomyces somaliensis DSM 40738]|uniref:EcsC family protein n=1 Tax=Streptomyces somaliensis (strain ATCC 33201 / DSM 40738 / JCM 12659 / KCTC 9044 / NCTC 11332 / NRRL B-12077 / IP 733) TaxID=1134445 RepID=A0AA44DB68_STRE0|nr:EcsC family protein [Streptomyces somaliensis]MCQ0025336.1 EcsC family protein [Streptomyces somaliensis DSM 40738]NKY13621.1 EcsC family protein [Streptomyces somaliensis DSM 40738]
MADEKTSGEGAVEKAGRWAAELAEKVMVKGVGPVTASAVWAEDRLSRRQGAGYRAPGDGERRTPEDMRDDIDAVVARLIKESVAAAGTQGFVTGLGGLITAGVTIPANVAASVAINMRLVGAIAHLRGWNLQDPHARTVAMMLAIGMSAQSVLANFGVKVGQKLGEQLIKKIPAAMLQAINKKAGFHLVAKYGTKRAAITLAKGVPILGGIVGGAVDAGATAVIGRTADKALRGDTLRAGEPE